MARPTSAERERGVARSRRVPGARRGDRERARRSCPVAVGAATGGELRGEMRDEERRRQQADRRERDAVVLGQRIGDRADVRHVPREAAADCEPGDDPDAGSERLGDRRRRRLGDPVDGLRREPVERGDRELEVLLPRVLELRVREAAEALDEEHHGRHAGAGHLGGVVEGAGRESVCRSGDLPNGLLAEAEERRRRRGSARSTRSARTRPRSPPPPRTARSPPSPRASIGRELLGVEVALVEELLRGLDDRRDDARPADDAAGRADRSAAGARGDVADRERELRRARERVAPLVHRRRARMGRLAPPGDPMTLDAERPEHDSEREVERLEDGALLDVELEVGGRATRARERASSARSRSTPCSASASGSEMPSRSESCRSSSWSAIDPAAALDPKRLRPKRAPSSSAQLTSRRVTGGVPSLRDPAEDLGASHDVEAAVEPAAVRDGVDVPADAGPRARTPRGA